MPVREPHDRSNAGDDTRCMLTVEEARARILSQFSSLDSIQTSILDALGLVLAQDVVASEDIPPFRNSAMDGFAVRSVDTKSASTSTPTRLTISGESSAGHGFVGSIERGTAIRIMTGAPMPEGADSVVRFEDVESDSTAAKPDADGNFGSFIMLTHSATPHQNVRWAGEDVPRGSVPLRRGTVIGPAHIGLLAALNRSSVKVIRRPKIAIVATGDEIVDPGPTLKPGQVRNSNTYLLAAMTRQFGGIPSVVGIAGDVEHDIISKLHECRDADLLVTSGGVSVGDFDVVKQVLRREGVVDLWQVRIKPGKPMAFGRVGETPVLGLPGNPVAAAVSYSQFGRPAIRRMLGLSDTDPSMVTARLEGDIQNPGSRRYFVRGVIRLRDDSAVVRPIGHQGSGSLSGLAQANCYIVIPEDQEFVSAGMTVNVELIDPNFPR